MMENLCKECYFSIFENSYIGILILDKNLKIKSMNRAFLNILNLKTEKVVNQNFLNFVNKNYQNNFLTSFDKLFKDESYTFNMELELKSNLKSIIWTDIRLSSIKESEFFVIFMEDITEKKILQAQNMEKEYMLIQQSKLAQMGEMLSMITHQWKQPLNNISTTITGLELRKEFEELTDSCVNRAMGVIQEQVNNMANIINTFTNFLKPNRDKREFNLYLAIEKIFNLMKIQLKLKNINYYLNLDKNLMIYGNENEFEQVIMNLIANSRDAFENIQANKEIILSTKQKNNNLELIFKDNAGGIKGNIMDDIFKPYFTTKDDGTGIGLYMSKLIIETHFNGTMGVKNIGNGVEFKISLKQNPLYK